MPVCDTGPVSSSVMWAGLGSGWGPKHSTPGVLSRPGHELLGQAGTSLILCPNLENVDTHLIALRTGMGELICIMCMYASSQHKITNVSASSIVISHHWHGSVPFAPTALVMCESVWSNSQQ
ncbi:unnamed protein product [Rangifer tarandus platyrhynchus]|uniref:Uncharacterized protein n=1 Tax=Rangifer tarandus platyrhynchus TaxID=3082113 RepID=A0AC59Y4G4_RANTA